MYQKLEVVDPLTPTHLDKLIKKAINRREKGKKLIAAVNDNNSWMSSLASPFTVQSTMRMT